MGKGEGIKIFLRIRPPATIQQSQLLGSSGGKSKGAGSCVAYDIDHSFDNSLIRFHVDRKTQSDIVNNAIEDFNFSFRRVFDPTSTQEEVFNAVAKDCVLSVIDGYNSTIFAYGQTGSGKTYSITGGTESYNDRGIIPRAIAMIYEEIAKRKEYAWMVTISYLQIYNDKGQDLLNHGKDAKSLDELPSVTVHEGEEDIILRGLEQHYAPTSHDALNLLFLGDTNRLYCETPMNKTSSRSHCVFTVSLEARSSGGEATVRRSKLNLVDLAGSERVSKTGVVGNTLTEAKYINLSLHFLETVIVALSEQAKGRRDHVPFRNSFMTMVLRDSLGANCRTSMLATAHPAVELLQETISTCKFSQRVALIQQDAHINEETDPALLVKKLRSEIAQLKDRLSFYEKIAEGDDSNGQELSEDEKMMCQRIVKTYLDSTDPDARLEGFEGNLSRIFYCFSILKGMIKGNPIATNSANGNDPTSSRRLGSDSDRILLQQQLDEYRSQTDVLQTSLQQKENEMNMLLDVLQRSTKGSKFNADTQTIVSINSGDGEHGYFKEKIDAALTAAQNVRDLIRSLRERGRLKGVVADSNTNHYRSGTEAAAISPYPISHSFNTAETTRSADGPINSSVEVRKEASAVPSPPVTAVLAHVSTMSQTGSITQAEAAAAEEYFKKQQEFKENYDLSALTDTELLKDRALAFEAFKRSYKQFAKVEASKLELKQQYDLCKETGRGLNDAVDTIKKITAQVQALRADRVLKGIDEPDREEEQLLATLSAKKKDYNEFAAKLRQQKERVDAMHLYMKRSQEQLTRDFDEWFSVRQKQVSLAANSNPRPDADPTSLPPLKESFRAAGSPSSSRAWATVSFPGGLNLNTEKNTNSVTRPPMETSGMSPRGEQGGIIRSSSTNLDASTNAIQSYLDSMPKTAPTHLNRLELGNNLSKGHPLSTVQPLINQNNNNNNNWVKESALPSGNIPLNQGLNLNSISPEGASIHISRSGAWAPSKPDTEGSPRSHNPYAPTHKSTGNAEADEQLAALYKAREALRRQIQG